MTAWCEESPEQECLWDEQDGCPCLDVCLCDDSCQCDDGCDGDQCCGCDDCFDDSDDAFYEEARQTVTVAISIDNYPEGLPLCTTTPPSSAQSLDSSPLPSSSP